MSREVSALKTDRAKLKMKYRILPQYDADAHRANGFTGHSHKFTMYWVYKNGIPMLPFVDKFSASQSIDMFVKVELQRMRDDKNNQ